MSAGGIAAERPALSRRVPSAPPGPEAAEERHRRMQDVMPLDAEAGGTHEGREPGRSVPAVEGVRPADRRSDVRSEQQQAARPESAVRFRERPLVVPRGKMLQDVVQDDEVQGIRRDRQLRGRAPGEEREPVAATGARKSLGRDVEPDGPAPGIPPSPSPAGIPPCRTPRRESPRCDRGRRSRRERPGERTGTTSGGAPARRGGRSTNP